MFFSPTLIKAAHILYAEHQHEYNLNSNTLGITETHSDCPICEFQFTQLIDTESYSESTNHLLVSDFTPIFNNSILKIPSLLSFNLRAPPSNSSI